MVAHQDTEQIKMRIKITDLAESLGIRHTNGKALCIWHQEKSPSLSFDDEKGIYKCFGCGESGDAITLYQKVKDVDFKTACEELGGIETKPSSQTAVREPENRPDPELYELALVYWLEQGRGEEVEKYLENRGIDRITADQFSLAGIKDLEATKEYLLTFGKERLARAGLIGKQGFIFKNHPIIIPIFEKGVVVALRGRSLENVKLKYLQPSGIPLPIFNADKDAEEVYLTEGEFDAITLCKLGKVAFGICGSNGFKESFLVHFNSRDVILAFDNDDAGKKATKEIGEKLKVVANSVRSIELPEGVKDVNECYQKKIDILSLPLTTIKEGIRIEHIADIAERQKQEMSMVKTPIGFKILDDAFQGGLRPGNTVVVAAVAGEGKTAFMQTMSYHYSKQGVTSLWFSYEETMAEIWERFEVMGVDKTFEMRAPIDFEDNRIDYIEKVIQIQKKKTDFFVLFVDQLSNLAPKIDSKTNINQIQNNISLYLGLMAKQIKELAMKYKIIIVIAHQLGRTGELAYSDMVRHAADKIVFLEREEAPSGGTEKFTNKTFLKINKNRPYGTRPIVPMTVYNGRFVDFLVGEMVQKSQSELGPVGKGKQFDHIFD